MRHQIGATLRQFRIRNQDIGRMLFEIDPHLVACPEQSKTAIGRRFR